MTRHDEYLDVTRPHVVCDDCPLNYDTIACNLGYEVESIYGSSVDNISYDCGLSSINHRGGIYVPKWITP